MADDISDNIKTQFEQFLSLVGNVLVHENEIHIVQNKLRRHFNSISSLYLCSRDFQSLLNNVHNSFKENEKSTKYFTLLASLDAQLKKHNVKLLGSSRSSSETSRCTCNTESIKTTSSTNEKTVIPSCKSPTTIPLQSSSSSSTATEHIISNSTIEPITNPPLASCNNIFSALNESLSPITNEQSNIPTNSINISEDEMKRKHKISKLERRLSNLSKIIRELEEKDMSLDEMRYCDLYLIESNLKKQAYEIYTKLATLRNQSSSVERILDQPVSLSETEIDHPLINKALEDMVNQTKFLPSFIDVLDTVEKTNDKYKLNLSVDDRKNLAEKSFKIIGTKIKNRRMADFNDIMNSRLPQDFDIERNDPALGSDEIEKTLLENEREALDKTEKIFEEFSQVDPDLESEINIESSEGSNDGSDEEEKGEEEEDDDDELESESDAKVAEPFGNKPVEIQYDIVDILPPFSPKFSSSSSSNVSEITNTKDPVEATMEISVSQHELRISSTASIPLKRATRNPFVSMAPKTDPELYAILLDDDSQESEPISIIQEHKVHTIIPRRRQQQQQLHTPTNNATGTLYNICKQRITSNDSTVTAKRSLPDNESSKPKKQKETSDIIRLD